MIGSLAVSLSAFAARPKWELRLPAGWTDITVDANKDLGVIAFAKGITDKGGTFESQAFQSEAGPWVPVGTLETTELPQTLAQWERPPGSRGRRSRS